MDYTHYNADARQDYLNDRIRALEAEHYGNIIAEKASTDVAGRNQAKRNLAIIEATLDVCRQELASLVD